MRARRFGSTAAPRAADENQLASYRWSQRFAQRIVRIAGWIYKAKRDEWWADLIFFQQKEDEAGLRLATSCLVSSPGLAWPHASMELAGWLLAAIVEVTSAVLRIGYLVVVRCVQWSPQALGVASCSLVGHWLPIGGISNPEIASLVILAPVGIYIGTTFPRAFLSLLGAAGGAAIGVGAGAEVGANMSLPLFAAAGILVGDGFGYWWAETVAAFRSDAVRSPHPGVNVIAMDRRPEPLRAALASGGRLLARMRIILENEARSAWARSVAITGLAAKGLGWNPLGRADAESSQPQRRVVVPPRTTLAAPTPIAILLPEVAVEVGLTTHGTATNIANEPRAKRRVLQSGKQSEMRRSKAAQRRPRDMSTRRSRPRAT